jgi:5,5'-dehydrodivanillate O-demethylase
MPNIFHMHTSIPSDPEIGWKESLIWWVPIDDENHRQFRVNLVPVSGQTAEIYLKRQPSLRSKIDMPHADVAEEILAGKLRLVDVDSNRTDRVRLEDDIAQIGQGRIADRVHERLGRADVGVILIRKLWLRELLAQEQGRPLTQWRRSPELRPMNWIAKDN